MGTGIERQRPTTGNAKNLQTSKLIFNCLPAFEQVKINIFGIVPTRSFERCYSCIIVWSYSGKNPGVRIRLRISYLLSALSYEQDLVVKQLFRVVDGDSLFCSAQDGAKKLITAELQHQLCNASLTAMPGSFTSSLLDVVVTFVATNVITVVIYHCYSIYNRRLWSVLLYFTSPPQL